MAKLSRMDTPMPSDAPSNTLPVSQVVAAALLCGLLSFGCFYSTGLGIASPSAQASSTASPNADTSMVASTLER